MAADSFESSDEESIYDLESFLLGKELDNEKPSFSSPITVPSTTITKDENNWRCTIKFEMAKTTDVGHIVFQVQDAQTVIETLPEGLLTEGATLILEGLLKPIRDLAIWRDNSWTICHDLTASSSGTSLSTQEALAALKVLSLLSEKYRLLQRIFWQQTPAGVMKEGEHYSIDERHEGEAPLHEIIKHPTLSLDEMKDILDLLITAGSNIDAVNDYGATPLYLAAYRGYGEIVASLLTHGANKEVVHSSGFTSLFAAARNGHRGSVELLLKHGANKEAASSDGATSLVVAAKNGHREVVELLLTHGVNIHAATNKGVTSLYIAAQNGHWEIVGLLLTHGANKDVALQNGVTSLHIAARRGHRKIVELLLIHGANKEVVYKSRYTLIGKEHTPLDAARDNNHQEIVELLTCSTFESLYPLLSPSTPIPPLYRAVLSRDSHQVQQLLLEGASLPSPNIRFFAQSNPLEHYINRIRFMTACGMIETPSSESIVSIPTLKVLVYMALLKNKGLPSWFSTVSRYLVEDFSNFETTLKRILDSSKEYPLSDEDREKFSLPTKWCLMQ
jgi:ankyrin repeat protein